MTNGIRKVPVYAWLLGIATVTLIWFNIFAAPRSTDGLTMALALTGLLATAVLSIGLWGLARRALSRAPRP